MSTAGAAAAAVFMRHPLSGTTSPHKIENTLRTLTNNDSRHDVMFNTFSHVAEDLNGRSRSNLALYQPNIQLKTLDS
jgi:hypothetical protein